MTETILPRWSKKALRSLVQQARTDGKRAILSKHVHELLYEVLEGIVTRLVRGFSMERQTCPAGLSDVDVIEHIIRYDAEMNFLLPDLPRAREQWNVWKQAENDQELRALPHYRMKNSLKRAIRLFRREMGVEKPRVMMDLVAMLLLVLENWIQRIAKGIAELSVVTRRTTVHLNDLRLVLRLTLPSQVWVDPILEKERVTPAKPSNPTTEADTAAE